MPHKVIFLGTPDFSAYALQALIDSPEFDVALVVTQPDRPAGRGKKLAASPVKRLALDHGIPVLQPHHIRKNLADFLLQIEDWAPFDIGVVSAFGQILPSELLDYPQHGCVNIHASLLPRWRGAAPIQRAIMAGDQVTGVCLMNMEAGLDTGGVYSFAEIPIEQSDTTFSLHDKLATLGAKLLLKDLGRIICGELKAIPQQEQGVTYAKKIKKEEARIDWSQTGNQLDCFVRGLNPWPGAFTTLGDARVKVFSLTPVHDDSNLPPGMVIQTDERLVVSCGQGAVELKELQLAGKKRIMASAFLRSGVLKPGIILGEL